MICVIFERCIFPGNIFSTKRGSTDYQRGKLIDHVKIVEKLEELTEKETLAIFDRVYETSKPE